MTNLTYLDRREAASYLSKRGLRISWKTLQKFATTGGGPIYRVFAGRAVYTADDSESWVASRISAPRRSTSETPNRVT